MRFLVSTSALPLSQYKKFKGKNKFNMSLYKDLFSKWSDSAKAYRIYLPLTKSLKAPPKILVPKSIREVVEKAGYVIDDYVAGIATSKDGKRKLKIGKILNKSKEHEIKKYFDADPQRRNSTKQEDDLLVVISRHPYDIAGMSTNRGWTSCTSLTDGSNKKYVVEDVKEGALVAYLVSSKDRNINKPIARARIVRYNRVLKRGRGIEKTGKLSPSQDHFLHVHGEVYGADHPLFRSTVDSWLNKVNKRRDKGLYCMSDRLYSDGAAEEVLIVDDLSEETLEEIEDAEAVKFTSDRLAEDALLLGDDYAQAQVIGSEQLSDEFLKSLIKPVGTKITKTLLSGEKITVDPIKPNLAANLIGNSLNLGSDVIEALYDAAVTWPKDKLNLFTRYMFRHPNTSSELKIRIIENTPDVDNDYANVLVSALNTKYADKETAIHIFNNMPEERTHKRQVLQSLIKVLPTIEVLQEAMKFHTIHRHIIALDAIPKSIMEQLFEEFVLNDRPLMSGKVLKHPSLTSEIILKNLPDLSLSKKEELAENPGLTQDVIEILYSSGYKGVLKGLAKNPKTKGSIAAELLEHDDMSIVVAMEKTLGLRD